MTMPFLEGSTFGLDTSRGIRNFVQLQELRYEEESGD